MGKVKTAGYAERKVDVNKATYQFTFEETKKNAFDSVKATDQAVEKYLKALKDKGFDIKMFRLEDQSNSRNSSYNSDSITAHSVKRISYECQADTALINIFNAVAAENAVNVYISVEFTFENEKELKKELLQEAVRNSKEKAEIIALANGEKVVGIDHADFDRYGDMDDADDQPIMYKAAGMNLLADELSERQETVSETVYITWNIE
ncbi:MAG: SIMPL domain-containing protein [Clostridia bacterium]|nr:SIMPL domain-containing protein [Clostridia bacterium]